MSLLDQISSDIDDLFLTDFAVDVIYTPYGGSATTIKGLFDSEYPAQNNSGGITYTPKVRVNSTDVSSPTKRDTFVIAGTTYYCFEPLPDVDGMKDIYLSKDSVI